MKKYLVNRVIRSIFSILMVMIISIVLIFSLVPLSYVVDGNADIADAKRNGGADAGSIKTLEVLKKYGYIEYVSQEDYCSSQYSGERYQTCIAKLDTNPDKQAYVKKYTDLGWEKIKLNQAEKGNATIVTRADVNNGLYTLQDGDYYKDATGAVVNGEGSLEDELYNAKGDVVTINNVVYFQKKVNPLKVFWSWVSNLITFDHKNKVENYTQWDKETEAYLTETDDTEVDNETEGSNRFAMLSGNAKLIVVCLCIVFLGMIALLVLIIVKFIKRKSYDDFDANDSFDEDFDSVTFDDDYKIETETEDTEE